MTAAGRYRSAEISGRTAVSIVALLVAAMFMGSTVLTPLYIIYEHSYHFSRITLTLVYAVYAVGNLSALLLVGRVSDIMGRRCISLTAIVIGAVSTLLFLLSRGTAWLFWARALSGVGIALAAGTATAWIAELETEQDMANATMIATSSNFLGLAAGSLMAGLLAQYAPWSLHLSFIVYLALLLITGLLIARTRETVEQPDSDPHRLIQRPRLGIPPAIRTQFIPPAVTVFGSMAFVGYYAALIPSILAENLHETNHAVAGAIFFELALIVAISVYATRSLSSRAAMLGGLVLLLPSLALLVAAQIAGSMTILLAGTAVSGVAVALGYRGSLQVVNQIAPEDQRAEVTSTYFVCGFTGNAVPVIGIGILSSIWSATIAGSVFAVTIGAFAIIALLVGLRDGGKPAR